MSDNPTIAARITAWLLIATGVAFVLAVCVLLLIPFLFVFLGPWAFGFGAIVTALSLAHVVELAHRKRTAAKAIVTDNTGRHVDIVRTAEIAAAARTADADWADEQLQALGFGPSPTYPD